MIRGEIVLHGGMHVTRATNGIKICNKNYGFTANPHLHCWANLLNTLQHKNCQSYFDDIKNLTFHNLCTETKIPPGTKQLLGLGPKFIPKTKYPTFDPTETLTQFTRDVRLKYFFSDTSSDPLTTNYRKIYIKSDFVPNPGNTALESRLSTFNAKITRLTTNNLLPYKHKHKRKHKYTEKRKFTNNLNPLQLQVVTELKQNQQIVTLLADKNLGPVVMDRSTYIKRVLTEHLLDTDTYDQISPTYAHTHLQEIHDRLLSIFDNPYSNLQNSLSSSEKNFFKRALHLKQYRIPTFYGLVKIHKSPWKLRPVVSCCGSLLAKVSSWIDFHLQSIRYAIPSYIKDSEELQRQLQSLHIPPHTKIFTCDAISMYTNIDIDHSITVVEKWFDKYKNESPLNIPPKLLIAALNIVMKNNIFTFNDTYWIQKTGTAMGTPCAYTSASTNGNPSFQNTNKI